MNSAMMIAAMIYSKYDGISKKICMQAKALSANSSKSILLCLSENGIFQINYENNSEIDKKLLVKYSQRKGILPEADNIHDLLNVAKEVVAQHSFDIIYIRHMLPSTKLLSFLSFSRIKSKIVYEIPTFPYYREQFNISNNKIRTITKLCIESAFWPFIYRRIDLLSIVRCRSNSLKLKKMFDMPNGYAGTLVKHGQRNCENLVLLGVGTIYPYHGYKKVISDMNRVGCKLNNGNNIEFHIVGESDEIDKLRVLVKKENMEKNVYFYGKKYGDELNKLYKKANMGVGTMALSLRNADIDTAIKNIEYFANYLPVVSSGKVFSISSEEGLSIKINEENPIDFNELYTFMRCFYDNNSIENKISELLDEYSWETIMSNIKNEVLDEVKCKERL